MLPAPERRETARRGHGLPDLEFTSKRNLQFVKEAEERSQAKAQAKAQKAQKQAKPGQAKMTQRVGRKPPTATATSYVQPTPAPYRLPLHVTVLKGRPIFDCISCGHDAQGVVDLGGEDAWIRCPVCQEMSCWECIKSTSTCTCGRKLVIRKK